MNTVTGWHELHELAKSRGIADPESCRVRCRTCDVELSVMGLSHWQDCYGEYEDIEFLKQDKKGKWIEVGDRSRTDPGPLAFSG